MLAPCERLDDPAREVRYGAERSRRNGSLAANTAALKFKLTYSSRQTSSAAFRLPSGEQNNKNPSPLCYIAARVSRSKSLHISLRD